MSRCLISILIFIILSFSCATTKIAYFEKDDPYGFIKGCLNFPKIIRIDTLENGTQRVLYKENK